MPRPPAEDIGDRRRRRPFPRSIVRRMRPELADFCSAAPRIEHPHRRFVAEQARMAVHGRELQVIEALHRPCRLLHPARQRLAVDGEAMAGKDLRLAIQRRAPGELRRGNPCDEGRRGHAALDQARARLGLNHRALAGPTGVFGADRAQDPKHRGNPIDHVVDVLANAVQRARAARTRRRFRFDRHIDAGEMPG